MPKFTLGFFYKNLSTSIYFKIAFLYRDFLMVND